MKRIFAILITAAYAVVILSALSGCKEKNMKEYENFLTTGDVGAVGHVQGVATDKNGEYFYYSVTDTVVKQAADGSVGHGRGLRRRGQMSLGRHYL